MTASTFVHRVQCAAIARGCLSFLVWESRLKTNDAAAERLLRLNGWRQDHGKWVCGNHEPPPEPVPD